MVRAFHRATRALCFSGALLLIFLMVAVITLDVGGRYLFAAPLHGGQDIVGMALFTLFVLILPYSFRGDFHVRMDLLYGSMPGWGRRIADVLGAVGAAVFAGALIHQAWINIPRFYQRGAGTLEVEIPYWPFNVLLLVAAAIMLVSVLLTVFGRPRAGREEA